MTNTLKLNSDFAWKALMFFCAASLILASSDSAFASYSSDPIGYQLCVLVATLSGGVAKAVATVAIIGVAGGLLLGKLNWIVALTVSVGVIIIFSAGTIVATISGAGGGAGVGTEAASCS